MALDERTWKPAAQVASSDSSATARFQAKNSAAQNGAVRNATDWQR
jgi:hypothetical protein